MMQAVKLYERAIEIDPDYAEPHVGIAEVFMIMGLFSIVPSKTAFDRARSEVNIALELDEELASAHGVRGFITTYRDYDFEVGERHLLRAIALDPSSAHFHCWRSNPLALRGRIDDCLAHVEKALELEPMSAIIQSLVGVNMQFGDPERGLHHLRNGFEMQPENPITGFYLGLSLGEFQGHLEEAIPPLEHSASRGWLLSLGLAASYHTQLGNLEEAARYEAQINEISKTRYVTPIIRALVEAGHQRADETLDALEACRATGDWIGFLTMFKRTLGFVLDHPRAIALHKNTAGQLGK